MSKTLVIYTSQTGFTKRYAQWLAEHVHGDLLTIKEAKRQKNAFFDDYNAIVYGGWAMAGKIVSSNWFLQKAPKWRDKKLALFCVGASPNANSDIDEVLDKILTEEQKNYIKVFYCQGGIDYSKMNGPSKLAMKALASTLKKSKNATQKEKEMADMIDHSYDIADQKYLTPIICYLVFCNN